LPALSSRVQKAPSAVRLERYALYSSIVGVSVGVTP
jgi:hypothetical protein